MGFKAVLRLVIKYISNSGQPIDDPINCSILHHLAYDKNNRQI